MKMYDFHHLNSSRVYITRKKQVQPRIKEKERYEQKKDRGL